MKITDFKNHELYPALYNVIDKAFPEHNFIKRGKEWQSKTYLFGQPHKTRLDKTTISEKYKNSIYEKGGEGMSLIDYVMIRDNCGFIEAMQHLCEIVGLTMPTDESFNVELYEKNVRKQKILNDSAVYFRKCLQQHKEKNKVYNYLEFTRGYTAEAIKQMGFGFIPSQNEYYDYLTKNKGHKIDEVKQAVILNNGIGKTHNLVIVNTSGNKVIGFNFRTVDNHNIKYFKQTDVDTSQMFFNICRYGGFNRREGIIENENDLIIVEGEIDALNASFKGLNNVVAIGSNNITENQIKHAQKLGFKRFTLCFDYDSDEQKTIDTNNKIKAAIKLFIDLNISEVFVSDLGGRNDFDNKPIGKIDPDSLIQANKFDLLKSYIKNSEIYYRWLKHDIFNDFAELQEKQGNLSDKQINQFQSELLYIHSHYIKNDIDSDMFGKMITNEPALQALGITQNTLNKIFINQRRKNIQEKKQNELQNIANDLPELLKNNDAETTINLISARLKSVEAVSDSDKYRNLRVIKDEAYHYQLMQDRNPPLKTNWFIDGINIQYPAGALTFICAPSSHGKTTYLINSMLELSNMYENQEFHFFSYEEEATAINTSFINCYISEDLRTQSNQNNNEIIENALYRGDFTQMKKDQIDSFMIKKDKYYNDLIKSGRIFIHYEPYTTEDLIRAINHLCKSGNVGGIFIDYVQLMTLAQSATIIAKSEAISVICHLLKECAIINGIPIILGAQFTRDVRNINKIHMNNIADSAGIERSANLAIGFWNCNMKEDYASKGQNTENPLIRANTLRTEIMKNRKGKANVAGYLKFDMIRSKIENDDSSLEDFFKKMNTPK